MVELDLNQYHSQSLADIHRQIELERNRRAATKAGGAKKSTALRIVISVAYALIVITAIAGGLIWYIDPFAKPVALPQVAPPPDVIANIREDTGFVQLQIFELDTAEPTAQPIQRDITPLREAVVDVASVTATPQNTTPSASKPQAKGTTVTAKPKSETPVKTQPVAASLGYNILFENVTNSEFEILKSIGKKYNIVPIVSLNRSTVTEYRLFTPKAGTGLFVENVEVEAVKVFNSREDAIAFASTLPEAYIKVINSDLEERTVKFCCLDIERSKQLAYDSNIVDRTIKIIKNNN